MSIIIKGLNMPSKCTRCIAFQLVEKPMPWNGDVIYEPSVYPYCVLLEREVTCDSKETDCPLVEIKTPHGRIVDLDEWIMNYDRADRPILLEAEE